MKWFVYKFVGKGVPLFSLDSIIFLIDIATWGVYPIFKHTQTTFYSDIYPIPILRKSKFPWLNSHVAYLFLIYRRWKHRNVIYVRRIVDCSICFSCQSFNFKIPRSSICSTLASYLLWRPWHISWPTLPIVPSWVVLKWSSCILPPRGGVP